MKRFLLLTAAALSMLLTDTQDLLFTPAQAAPALRRVVTLKQPDGSTLSALPMGDEHVSFWQDAQTGRLLIQDAATHYWRDMTEAEIKSTEANWTEAQRRANRRAGAAYTIGGVTPVGEVRLPVVLVEFADVKLSADFGTIEFTNDMLNNVDFDRVAYTSGGKEYHTGSVRKYWNAQSFGQFDPQFDLLGKISLPNPVSHYGAASDYTHDTNISGLISEVVDSLKQYGWMDNAAQYDNNHDGILDCLYIIYAGFGENELYEQTDLIWAKNTTGHIYTLPDNTKTNLFLLSPELFGASGGISVPNIGVFTHEFGHSIGMPDFYSTNASTQSQCYGMDSWSLMDQGEYNGRGQIPGCLTAHERMLLGWLEPTTLDNDTRDTLDLFVSTGDARIFRNPENENEYITIENHQPENPWEITWGVGGYYSAHKHEGLLITYVNFDQSIWNGNSPNNDPNFQRCAPVSADGVKWLYSSITKEELSAWKSNLSADIYPGLGNVKKLNSDNPLFRWHNGDTIAFNINNIEQLSDRRVVITFGNPQTSSIQAMSGNMPKGKAIKRLLNGQIYIEKDGAYYDLLGRKVSSMK